LYPFEQTVARPDASFHDAIETIDIGGPAMLRAAAKNHDRVTVIVDPADYARVLGALRADGVTAKLKRELAMKTFAHTARYDGAIAAYLSGQSADRARWPDPLAASFRLVQPLRYGENPHQRAAWYRTADDLPGTVAQAQQLQGKELSFNNLADADAAWQCARAFERSACVIVKHANPCGVAVAADPAAAYELAYRTDPTSAFGGVIAFNEPLDRAAARSLVARQFAEVVIAPEISADALAELAKKPAIRVLQTGQRPAESSRSGTSAGPLRIDVRSIEGGLLVQEPDVDHVAVSELRTVTRRAPTAEELADLKFAFSVAKFVKSNAIVYARGGATLGIGAGQPSRVLSAKIAALKAHDERLDLKGCVMASDAFFPFRDGIDVAAEHGIKAVIHPGGSMRDDEVIAAADEHGIAMVLTGIRHFRH
jgi:phosphoribosylaminoimidazolecarboxamide formyltransferase/IMP cyclohydrolase